MVCPVRLWAAGSTPVEEAILLKAGETMQYIKSEEVDMAYAKVAPDLATTQSGPASHDPLCSYAPWLP